MGNQIGKKQQLHKTTDSVLHNVEQTLLPRRSLLTYLLHGAESFLRS